MVAVEPMDAMKYGVRLLGYLIVVFIAGGILIVIGASFLPTTTAFGPRAGNPILALLFYLVGFLVIYAGSLGLIYKVIADGVEIGNRAADQPLQEGGQQPAPTSGQGQ